MITILDVLENFISSQPSTARSIQRMPGRALAQLGEEVRRFARNYTPPVPCSELHPIYLGGWPSANFWDGQNGSLAMTSLLYSGQLLAKDPVSDWFSMEQYQIPTLMAARQGFINPSSRKFNTYQTRCFLSNVVPELFKLRPLIQNGIIVLVPSKSHIAKNAAAIEDAAAKISTVIGNDLREFTTHFTPRDLPMEDNVRGMVVFAGGEREKQIMKALHQSAWYFAAEYSLAAEYGFYYTAPFEYEAFLCEEGLGKVMSETMGMKIQNSILNSRLKVYRGLTPELISSLRDDENFGAFRAALYQTYRDIPATCSKEELDRHIREAEATLIEPSLREIQKEASSGILSRMGIEFTQAAVRMGAGILAGAVISAHQGFENIIASAGAGAFVGFCASLAKSKKRGAKIIWKRLCAHNISVKEELPRSKDVSGEGIKEEEKKEYWGIPEVPSMHISITAGTLIMDTIVPPGGTMDAKTLTGSVDNPYGLCPCQSGLKYKFCCKGLETNRLTR